MTAVVAKNKYEKNRITVVTAIFNQADIDSGTTSLQLTYKTSDQTFDDMSLLLPSLTQVNKDIDGNFILSFGSAMQSVASYGEGVLGFILTTDGSRRDTSFFGSGRQYETVTVSSQSLATSSTVDHTVHVFSAPSSSSETLASSYPALDGLQSWIKDFCPQSDYRIYREDEIELEEDDQDFVLDFDRLMRDDSNPWSTTCFPRV